jgi:hypothetical protein
LPLHLLQQLMMWHWSLKKLCLGGASIEECSKTLVTKELSLLRKLSISSSTCANPLTWWWMHEGQFLDMSFFANQILGILSSKIETKQVFNLVGVLIALKCCHLQVDNMDWILIIVKNWPNDPRANCKAKFKLQTILESIKTSSRW